MSKEKEYISLKVVSYAICDFLYALLNNGVYEGDIFITKEDDYLVVRLPIESLSNVKYRNEDMPQCGMPQCNDFQLNSGFVVEPNSTGLLSTDVDEKFNEVQDDE